MKKSTLAKAAKLRGRLERDLLRASVAAVKEVREMQEPGEKGDGLWADRTKRDVINLDMVKIAAAGLRAERMADAGPKVFGVVAVVNRIDDHAKWEEMARAIDAGKQVIDVEALNAVPAEKLHGSRRAVGGVQEQLARNLPASEGKAEAGEVDAGVSGRSRQRETRPELHLRVPTEKGGEAGAGKEEEGQAQAEEPLAAKVAR